MGTAVQNRDESKEARDLMREKLVRYAPSFEKVLPRHLTAERMVTLALVAATKTPALLKCSPESIALSVMRISTWGLEIGTTAHLVPFKGECTAIADWKGKVELAIRSGFVRKVTPRAVYAGEPFEYEYGLNERLVHRPNGDEASRGAFTHAYAIAVLRAGVSDFEVLTKADVDAVRAKSPMPNSPAWTGHYAEMGKKTAVHKLLKRVPQSASLADALAADEEAPGALSISARMADAVGATRDRIPVPPPVLSAGYGDDAPAIRHPNPLVERQANAPDPYDEQDAYEQARDEALALGDERRPARGRDALREG